ncbi:MAG: hypothetical protein KDI98_05210 [Hyphomicrobiaceae bacterium]|nr:hypothetical protein [Hyphomicrobiaceae bacterium]
MKYFKTSALSLLLIAPLVLLRPALAEEAEAPEWMAEYTRLIRDRSYTQAYELVSAHRGQGMLADELIARHLIAGDGVQQDLCGAVALMEKYYPENFELNNYILDEVYNYSWMSVASIEGSATASFRLASGYYNVAVLFPMQILQVHEFQLTQAYIHFSRAFRFGYVMAADYIDSLLYHHPWLADVEVDYSTQSIICPVRVPIVAGE